MEDGSTTEFKFGGGQDCNLYDLHLTFAPLFHCYCYFTQKEGFPPCFLLCFITHFLILFSVSLPCCDLSGSNLIPKIVKLYQPSL